MSVDGAIQGGVIAGGLIKLLGRKAFAKHDFAAPVDDELRFHALLAEHELEHFPVGELLRLVLARVNAVGEDDLRVEKQTAGPHLSVIESARLGDVSDDEWRVDVRTNGFDVGSRRNVRIHQAIAQLRHEDDVAHQRTRVAERRSLLASGSDDGVHLTFRNRSRPIGDSPICSPRRSRSCRILKQAERG